MKAPALKAAAMLAKKKAAETAARAEKAAAELAERQKARKDPDIHTNAAPQGYRLKGVSTLRTDAQGNHQWVKTEREAIDPDIFAKAFLAAIDATTFTPRPAAPAIVTGASDRLHVLPIGDPHFGMLAWGKESGTDWDLKIAAQTHHAAVERLLGKMPLAAKALIVWMGDQAHANDQSNATPTSKHRLDTDSRWERMLSILFTAICNSVNVALTCADEVVLRIIKGNHDPEVAAALALAAEAYYRNEPRVQVERAPTPLYVTTWGRVLLAFAHGHAPDPARVQDILSADYRKEMGETEQGYLYTGHKHCKILSERGGLIMEAVQTLAPRDAYATHAGYRSGRGLFVDTYDKRFLVATDRASVAAQDLGV